MVLFHLVLKRILRIPCVKRRGNEDVLVQLFRHKLQTTKTTGIRCFSGDRPPLALGSFRDDPALRTFANFIHHAMGSVPLSGVF
jgi:hypothetical protein